MDIDVIGALCFGAVIGWITYLILHRREGGAAISDIAVVIGAIGGGGVTALFETQRLFSCYCIGLFFGFSLYFLIHRYYKGSFKAVLDVFDKVN